MRLDVFKGDDLVAAFEYGKHRSYYGAPGRQVKALIERPHCARNLWTGETMRRPATDRPDWWAANILSAGLAGAGFRVSVSMALDPPRFPARRPTEPLLGAPRPGNRPVYVA